MRPPIFAVLLFTGLVLAQDNPVSADAGNSKHDKDQITVQGCVTRSSGDYVLIKQDPGLSYELQATGQVRLKKYLGQRVEVTGDQSPTLSSSSDAINRTGSASPVTITVRSIRTINKECTSR